MDRPAELVGSEMPSFLDNLSEEMRARMEALTPVENSILTHINHGQKSKVVFYFLQSAISDIEIKMLKIREALTGMHDHDL